MKKKSTPVGSRQAAEKRIKAQMLAFKDFIGLNHCSLNMFNPQIMERRTRAIMHYLPIVNKKYPKRYPILNAEEVFINYTCFDKLHHHDIAHHDLCVHWSYAAAMWLASMLRSQAEDAEVDLSEYMEGGYYCSKNRVHIPEDFRPEDDIMDQATGNLKEYLSTPVSQYAPMISNADTLISALANLIQLIWVDDNRNLQILHSNAGKSCAEHCKKLLEIVSLLNPDTVDTAVSHLEEKMWESFEALLRSSNIVDSMQDCGDAYANIKSISLEKRQPSDTIQSTVLALYLLEGEVPDHMFQDRKCSWKHLTKFKENFEIPNPFELCFAIFYLCAKNDNLAWLYTPIVALLEHLKHLLPWTGWLNYDGNDTYISDPSLRKPKSLQSFLQTLYFFFDNKCITDYNGIQKYADQMIEKECPEEYAMLYGLICELYKEMQSIPEHIETVDTSITDEKTTEPAKQIQVVSSQTNVERTVHSDQNASSEREIAELKKQLQAVRHQLTTANKQIESLNHQLESDKDELALLREFRYSFEHEEAEQYSDKPLPKHAQKKILCFGGTPNWKASMQEVLPDVVFTESGINPNQDAVKNASELWLQWKCSKHKEYNSIRNIAKKKGIPIHYFHSTGVKSCSEQLIGTHR